jgi:hypothetical protein
MQYSHCVLSIYRPFAFNYLAAIEEAKNLLAAMRHCRHPRRFSGPWSYVIGFLAPR